MSDMLLTSHRQKLGPRAAFFEPFVPEAPNRFTSTDWMMLFGRYWIVMFSESEPDGPEQTTRASPRQFGDLDGRASSVVAIQGFDS